MGNMERLSAAVEASFFLQINAIFCNVHKMLVDSSRNVAITKQCMNLAKYGLCYIGASEKPNNKDEINTWHALTPSLIQSLQQ